MRHGQTTGYKVSIHHGEARSLFYLVRCIHPESWTVSKTFHRFEEAAAEALRRNDRLRRFSLFV